MTAKQYNEYTSAIIECAIDVHKELGPGLLESVYEICLARLLEEKGIYIEAQKPLPVILKINLLAKIFISIYLLIVA
jgi:GxxExxY protein